MAVASSTSTIGHQPIKVRSKNIPIFPLLFEEEAITHVWSAVEVEALFPAFSTSEPFTEGMLASPLVAVESTNRSHSLPTVSAKTSMDDWPAIRLQKLLGHFLAYLVERRVQAHQLRSIC